MDMFSREYLNLELLAGIGNQSFKTRPVNEFN